MGCDGGVLAMQRKYMRNLGHKMNDKPTEEMNRRARALIRTRCCAASNELLTDRVMACELGNLFNKEAVITALLERTLNPAFCHIRGIKDLIECKFTINPKYTETAQQQTVSSSLESKGESAVQIDEDSIPKYICPVTMVEMNAKQPFVVLRTTGWVMSERAVREIGVANLQGEYGPFTAEDVIKIAPEAEDEDEMRQRMKDRRANAKKEKKRRREEAGGEEGAIVKSSGKKKEKGENGAGHQAKQHQGLAAGKAESGDSTLGVKASSVAQAAAKAVEKEMASSNVYKSIFSDGKTKLDSNKLFIVSGAARYTIS